MKKISAIAAMAFLPLACAALDKGEIFDSNGIRYQVIESSEPSSNEVMICSPTATDREYLLPIQEDGTILIPTHVEYDGVTYTV